MIRILTFTYNPFHESGKNIKKEKKIMIIELDLGIIKNLRQTNDGGFL